MTLLKSTSNPTDLLKYNDIATSYPLVLRLITTIIQFLYQILPL